MAFACATEGTSRATIKRSRASKATSCSLRHEPRHLHETFELRAKQIGDTGIGNIVHVVECRVGARDCQLLGYDKCATAKFENLAQRHQRAKATGATGKRKRIAKARPLKAA